VTSILRRDVRDLANIEGGLTVLPNLAQRRAPAAPHAQFCSLLRAFASRLGGLRMVVHFYSGSFGSEDIRTVGWVSVAVDRVDEAGIVSDDKRVEVVAGAG